MLQRRLARFLAERAALRLLYIGFTAGFDLLQCSLNDLSKTPPQKNVGAGPPAITVQ
jgi:hypothetical protein